MSPRALVFAFGALLVFVGWWLQTRSGSPDTPPPPKLVEEVDRSVLKPEIVSDETAVGLAILEGYGAESQGLREDLDQLGNLLTSYLTLNKADDPLPLASNLDIAAALRGVNPFRMALLPEEHRAFSAEGEFIDRFGNAIFFHALSGEQVEIRSAGPDGRMWTADDLQRQPNGRFLNAASASDQDDQTKHP